VLGDYNLKLKHLPGTKNHADGLSRRPDYDQGGEDNDAVTTLPNELFARVISDMAFDEQIHRQQEEHLEKIEEWRDKYNLKHLDGNWWKGTAVTIHRNHAYQKLFSFIIARPNSLPPLLSPCTNDRHVVKLHLPFLAPFV
jgi:hypothetical protein